MKILSIDPGTTQSGYCFLENCKPVKFGKIDNSDIIQLFNCLGPDTLVALEMFASYGMSVGESTFRACRWLGRFEQVALMNGHKVYEIFRKDVKMNLCNSMRAKDSNITQALVDRFAYDRHKEKGHGKGTKTDPGFFYGFAKDVWSAYAIGITLADMIKAKKL